MRYKIKLVFSFIGILISVTSSVVAQTVIIDDNFSDGDFTNNPSWTDPESKHIVNSSNLLQLDAAAVDDEAAIFTSSTAAYGEWEVLINMDFATSSTSLSRFYILAHSEYLKGNVNGYFIEVGNTPDEVSLYRQDGNTTTKIIDGTDGFIETNPVNVRVKVKRDINGNWDLLADSTGGTSFKSQGTTTDNAYAISNFVGLFSKYIGSRSTGFEYDDIKVTKINPPLDIQNVTILDTQTIDVFFNLDIDPTSVQTSDFTITPNTGSPGNISISGNVIQLTYNNPIPGGEYSLTVSNIDDNEGNTIEPNTNIEFQFFDSYADGDLIINEFAYDYPTTINEEYIEIKNTSNKYLNIAGWHIADNNSSSSLGSDPIPIKPNGFLVISADTTELFNVFGDREYHQASFPALNNTTPDAVQLITNTGAKADSLTYNSDWGGTDVSLERRSAITASYYRENWNNSPNPNGGTPGTTNEATPDDTAPQLIDLNILSAQTLQLVFDKRLDQTGSYSIDNSTISAVDQTAADTVELALGSNLQNAQTYTLYIENTTDIFDNSIAPIDTSFTFYDPSPADSGDVVINEFMYTPPSTSSEYIELYNHSNKSLDLQGWTLSDSRTDFEATISSNRFIVPPNSYVAITPDNTIKSEYPDIALISMSDFPALNNGGDQIIIRNEQEILLDSLAYTSDWGGDEVALERRTVNVSGTYQSNWGDSPNGFGTPGYVNEIGLDQNPPDLTNFNIKDNISLEIDFNETIQQQSLKDPTNYQLSGPIEIDQAIAMGKQSVLLTLTSTLQNAVDYQLTIDGIQDIYSNSLTNRDTTFTYYEISEADSGDVFISEFMSVPPSGYTEYVELRNTTIKSFDLQYWTINDNTGNRQTITEQQFILPPDSVVVIAPDQTLKTVFPNIALITMGSSFPSLNNNGDDVVITNRNGTRLDSLQYQGNWGTEEIALERKSFNLSALYQNNWDNSPNGFGTPGTKNEIGIDTEPPSLLNMTIQNNREILLIFSEYLDRNSAEDATNFTISGSLSVNDTHFAAPDSIFLSFDGDLQNTTSYNLSIENIADLFSNSIAGTDTSFTYYKVSTADSSDVAINEFMYIPPSGSSEYIELYNRSDKSLDIKNWMLSDNRKEFEAIISNTQFIVPPDSFVVIAPDNTLKTEFPDIALVTMSDFPALNNGGDQIIVRNSNSTLLDSLAYTPDWGGNEIALERRNVDISGTYQSNWDNAPNGLGTPGSTNEIQADETPPDIASLNITTSNSIEVGFNEPIQQQSLKNPTNYQLSSPVTVDKISASGQQSVTLTLTDELQSTVDYHLTIDGIKDIHGNSLTNRDTTFTYYEISVADSGDVFISEFMSVPPTGSTEYIELRNTSSMAFDLQGWTINDNTGNLATITETQQILPPDSAIIVAPDPTLKTTFTEIALIEMGPAFPSLNNSGDDIVIRTANGTRLDALQYRFDWGTDEISLERRSYGLSAIYQSNWGDSPNGFGTPGSVNDIDLDTDPPTLESLTVRNSQELLLTFSEYLNAKSAENINNFSLSGNSSVYNAQFSAPDSILLSFDTSLQNTINYNLSIENITDLFDNPIAPTDTAFIFYEASPADSGDIAINEFMYEPPANSSEYIELYNYSDKSLDIQDWTLSDNRENFEATISNKQSIIPPDSFIVIAPDNTIKSEFPDITLLTVSDFPALNNGTDQIIIRNQNGLILDSLAYSSDWGGDKVALERRTVDVSGTFQSNWGNAPNGLGTPGIQNKITKDNSAPLFEQVIAKNDTKIELSFSEKITPVSATNEQNYQLSPSIGIQLISVEGTTVTLFLEQPLTDGMVYEVTVSNLSDTFGNILSSSTQEFEYLKIEEAHFGQIVINEILYDPGNEDKADFIELYNTTDKNFDITEWVIGDYSTETTIERSLQLEAGEYIVFTGNQSFSVEIPNGVTINGFPSLNNNTPDDIYIRNKNGVTIDSLRYYQSWDEKTDGASLERRDPLAASNDPSNWQANSSNDGISAGNKNISFQEDTAPPKIIFSNVLPKGGFEVHFNEFIKQTDDISFYYRDQQLAVSRFDSTNANYILLESPNPKTTANKNNNKTLKAENISDIKGNITQSAEIPISQKIQTGDLVINEIMFNPIADSDDNLPDQTEYIELRNTRDYAISLEGLFLHDQPDEKGDIRDIHPISTTAKWVPPQGHVLVHADETTNFEESLTATFFDLDSPNLQSIMQADRSSLSLASSEDAIYIADSTGATIDSVFYDENWHNPNIIDTRGIALERINPNGPSNDPSNWGSNVTEKGGTPNNENSIYQENSQIAEETGISFEPNPFSPDDDGYEDNLFINYKLDHQDYLMKVRIYDRYGRLVRTMANGERAGFEGQLIWDGRKDDRSRNRIGIYIVIFEAYDSASGSDKTFKKTVVLARQLN